MSEPAVGEAKTAPAAPAGAPGRVPGAQDRRYSARQVAGLLVLLAGLGVLASAALLNPWVSRLWKGASAVQDAPILLSYLACAGVLGVAAVLWGDRLARSSGPRAVRLTLLFGVLGAVVLCDRLLLLRFKLTPWTHDPVLKYRNRAGTTWTLASFGRPGDLVRINRYGHHDDEFPESKPAGETRILALGDSVTMGFGVTYRETFSAHLEALLGGGSADASGGGRSYQVINTGVHGYSSRQELGILRESLRFSPDAIVVGFCMNDVTDAVRPPPGSREIDYHGVVGADNAVLAWLVNETGFGRLSQKLFWRNRSAGAARRAEAEKVRRMTLESDADPALREAWDDVLGALGEIYSIGRERGVPVILVLFPFDFQLVDDLHLAPQRRLSEHAARHGVPVVDTTPAFRAAVFGDEDLLRVMRDRGYSSEEIRSFHEWKLRRYFFDEDHFTEAGHAVAAREILRAIRAAGLAGGPAPEDPR